MERKKKMNFNLVKKIAAGAFGEIHLAVEIDTHNTYAVKIEKRNGHNQLRDEYLTYLTLIGPNYPFIPSVYHYSQYRLEGEIVNGMVMDLMGPSLQELFERCNKKFTLKTVLMLGEQIIPIIEHVHSKNFVHRDIKPDNFVVGNKVDAYSRIHLIDFGLAKLYRNAYTLKFYPMRMGKSLTGTARFASLNAHLGYEQGRRDDLESFIYCLIFFANGRLPWQGLTGNTKKEKYDKIRDLKASTPISTLCKGLPPCFSRFLEHVKDLNFEEIPSYLYLRKLFSSAMKEFHIINDQVYDWMLL